MIIAYSILLAAILIVAFFMCLKAYWLGYKHGKQVINNEVPKIEPVREVIQHFEAKKEEQKIESAIEDYWS